MATATVQITAKKVGEVYIPLVDLVPTLASSGQIPKVNSFDSNWSTFDAPLGGSSFNRIIESVFFANTRWDTLFHAANAATANGPWRGAQFGGRLGYAMQNPGGTNTFGTVLGIQVGVNSTLSNIPMPFNFSHLNFGTAGSRNPNGLFNMIIVGLIQLSPIRLYVRANYFGFTYNNVANNTVNLFLFNPQIIGPVFAFYPGPCITATAGVFPQTLTFEGTAQTLTYTDNFYHVGDLNNVIPDYSPDLTLNFMNRWFSPSNGGNRILEFMPGQPLGSGPFNVDAVSKVITFDDATVQAAMTNNAPNVAQAAQQGWLLKSSTAVNYRGQPQMVVLLKSDGTKYYVILFQPQGPIGRAAIAGSGFNVNLNSSGTFYVQNGSTNQMATSFGVSIGFNWQPIGATLPPLVLPCFTPCLPWPIGM